MLHQSMEITRLLIIALPCTFLAFAGLDLALRIASAFNVRTTIEIQIEQALEVETMSEVQIEPVAATSTETQTEQEVDPTCNEQKPTSPELKSPLPIETPLSQLKRYKLHGHDVVPISQLPITVPATVKRYKLRGEAVVRLSDLA